jgi:hypothetical protein
MRILLLFALITLILTGSWRVVMQAIEDFISRFRGGGPGSPSHPLPANDSRILLRRRAR